MTVQKDCADHLRSVSRTYGHHLGSGHAHEIVAAYFGYGSAAALRADFVFPVARLSEAVVLVPDLARMEERMSQLNGLSPDFLGHADEIAESISTCLVQSGHYSGAVWRTSNLQEYVQETFMEEEFGSVLDDLAGETAETNAYFDELIVDTIKRTDSHEAISFSVEGELNGDSDPERPFSGDKINFSSEIALVRIATRVGFARPTMSTSGSVDYSYYDEDEEAA